MTLTPRAAAVLADCDHLDDDERLAVCRRLADRLSVTQRLQLDREMGDGCDGPFEEPVTGSTGRAVRGESPPPVAHFHVDLRVLDESLCAIEETTPEESHDALALVVALAARHGAGVSADPAAADILTAILAPEGGAS